MATLEEKKRRLALLKKKERLAQMKAKLVPEASLGKRLKESTMELLDPAVRGLDFLAGMSRTEIADVISEVMANEDISPEEKQKLRDFITEKHFEAARSGEAESASQLLERAGVGAGPSLSDTMPILFSEKGEDSFLPEKGGPLDVTGRGLIGFLGDTATDPLTLVGAPIAKVGVKAAKGAARIPGQLVSGGSKFLTSKALNIKPSQITKYADRYDILKNTRGADELTGEIEGFMHELNKDVQEGLLTSNQADELLKNTKKELSDLKRFKTKEARDLLAIEKKSATDAAKEAKDAFVVAENRVVTDMAPVAKGNIDSLHQEFIDQAQEGASLLPKTEGVLDPKEFIKEIDEKIKDLKFNDELVGVEAQEAANKLSSFKRSLEGFGEKQLTGAEAKQFIRIMDRELTGMYKGTSKTLADVELFDLRTSVDKNLKGRFPEYDKAMEKASETAKLRDDAIDVFKSEDKAARVLQKLDDPRNIKANDVVDRIKEKGGPDLKADLKAALEKETKALDIAQAEKKRLSDPALRQERLNIQVDESAIPDLELSAARLKDELASRKDLLEQFPEVKPKASGDISSEKFIERVGAKDPDALKTSGRLGEALAKDITQEAQDVDLLRLLSEPKEGSISQAITGVTPKGALDKAMPFVKASRKAGKGTDKLIDILGAGSEALLGKTIPRRTLIELLTQKDEPQIPFAR